MKISKETIEHFQKETGLFLYFGLAAESFIMTPQELKTENMSLEDCNYVQILGFTDTDYICTQFKAPVQKEVEFKYLMKKLNQELKKYDS